MASPVWIGSAKKTIDLWTLTPGGTIEAGDIFIVTIGQKSVSVSATDTTVAITCDDIVAALQALDSGDYPEFAEYTFADATTAVTATANTAGVPGTISVSTTESDGGAADAQTFVATHTTTGTGPNNWDNAANWSTGAVPVNSDTPIIENSAVSILYGIDQNAVTLTSLEIRSTFTGSIGLPRRNSAGYAEYRETYLKISITTLNIGQGDGKGSRRLKINTGSAACTLTVFGTGEPVESGVPALLWVGTHASNVLNVSQGSVGVATFSGEAANLSGGLRVGYETSRESDARVLLGSGTTLATITQTGGTVEVNSNSTTINRTGGTLTVRGTATITTLNNFGGTVIDESTGTITTVNNYAVIDRRRVISQQTWTNTNLYPGSKTYTPLGTSAPAYGVTFTNAVQFYGCAPGEGATWEVGVSKKYTVADI